jgi:flagellar M-ring protein FliF
MLAGPKPRTAWGEGVQGLAEFFKKLGAGRLAAMGAVTVGLVAFFAFVIMRFSEPNFATLFTGLDIKDSAAIVKELESSGVPYELRGDGSAILVPADRVARLRMSLAQDGLPSGGGVGYEIFDKGDSLSATNFVQNINQLRALEGELARTIRTIDRVDQARVHLVIPERALFQRDREPPSASIALKVRGGLEPGQIRAIRHLVASAVEGLKPERVSVVDESGALLADGAGSDTPEGGADDRQANYEKRLSEQVQRIVESVVGSGRAQVKITAELDFNRITQTQDTYDPDSKVVRSTQTREESSSTAARDQSVTVGNELPNATGQGGPAPSAQDLAKKSEETINYEISRTTRTETIDGGRVKRVSVAVLVDGIYSKDNSGGIAYAPRSKEDVERIAALVRSAIGFDQQRGDQVEVVNLRFAEAPAVFEAAADQAWWASYLSFTKEDIMRLVELGILLILSLLVLLFVVRPLLRRAIAPDAPTVRREPEPPALTGPAGAMLAAATAEQGPPLKLAMPRPEDNLTLQMLEVAQASGDIQQKSVERIGELVERNPTETVSLIRTWLNEPAS